MLPRLQELKGFRKQALAFLLGAVMTLTLPPLGIFPLLLLCIPAFITLSSASATKGGSFLTGWMFGCGYFIFGLYWVSAALFVDIEQWKWVLPLSLVAGPAVLALFYGFIPLIAHRFRGNASAHALIFVAAFAGIEWIRGHALTGFPWNLAGYTWHHVLPLMQTSAAVGIYGLTLLTLFWAAAPVYCKNKKLLAAAGIIFAIAAMAGSLRLAILPPEQNGDNLVRVVQANIPQSTKWDKEEDWRNIEKHAELSKSDAAVTFVVWPETSVPSDLSVYPEIADYIARSLPPTAIGLIGNLRVVEEQGMVKFYNSVTALGQKGKVVGVYDKFHLVPFGEYIPFRDKLNLTPIALAIAGIGDFTPGQGNKTLRFADHPAVSPLVCYEAIFPRAVADRNDRPEWIVNVTNDGWYGRTAGPHQHFEITRVRAIEEGLPFVRAANTGISAVVDPLGRIAGKTKLLETTALEVPLPAPLPPTFYSQTGDAVFFGMLALLAALGVWVGRKQA